jgi:hypothetical protein
MRCSRPARHAFHDADSRAFQLFYFVRVVREQAHAANAEKAEGGSGKTVVARVGGKTEFLVGFYCVHSAVLQLVGAQLVHQADAAAFLGKVEQNAGRRRGNPPQRKFELRAAIASFRGEYVAGKALRVDAYQRGLAANAAVHQGHGAFLRAGALDTENFKLAETRRKLGSRNDPNAGLRRLARFADLSACFAWHGEPRIIAGAPSVATLYIGTAIG